MNIYCLLLLSVSFNVSALNWQDLWTTKDQQAQRLMQKKEFTNAQKIFQHPSWRAAAAYRAGEYSQAAADYSALNTAESYYNQGNALAKLGQYETAMKAYDNALKINPRHEDAIYNRKLIESLLQKKKEQQKNENASGNESEKQERKNSSQQAKPLEKKSNDENPNANPSPNQELSQEQTDKQKKDNKQKREGQAPQKTKPYESSINEKGKNESSFSRTSEQAHEKQMAKEQLLRLIPDDPGGLLREKFLRDHLRRQQGNFR